MFWHGRGQGGKLTFFLISKLSLSFCWVISSLTIASVNGFSATIDIRAKLLSQFLRTVAFYSLSFLSLSWVLHDNQIDNGIEERDLKFRMCDMYAFNRKDMKKFYRYYAYALATVLVPCILTRISLLLDDARGIMSTDGQLIGHDLTEIANILIVFFSFWMWIIL